MKNSILSVMFLLFAGTMTSAIAQEIIPGAAIEFTNDVHNYGDVAYSGNGTYTFTFKNTGTEALLITDAKGSCGCTVPTWSKEPIMPGKTGSIDVTYDTKRVGAISKSVTVTSNAVNTPIKVIRIEGNVLPAPVDETVNMTPPTTAPMPVVEKVEEKVEVVEVAATPPTKAEIKAMKAAEKLKAKEAKKMAKLAKKSAKPAEVGAAIQN